MPASASAAVQGGGAWLCHTAPGSRASQSSTGISASSTACASSASHGPGVTAARRASGVTTKLTTGIAIAFATGATAETCWNSTSRSGASPTVIAHCTRPQPIVQCASRSVETPTYNITATAANDSQNPGETTAHGSASSTTASAIASTREEDCIRSSQSAAATTAIMYRVRCAGTANPASSV